MFKRVRFTTAASPKAKRSRGEMEVLHSPHFCTKMPDASTGSTSSCIAVVTGDSSDAEGNASGRGEDAVQP